MEVKWKGKIGYGDIISPICYVHNEAIRRKEDVQLKFYWDHSKGTKFKPQDPETINERADFIFQHTEPVDGVSMEHIYNHPMSYNHTNYFDADIGLHNLRFSNKYFWNGSNNHIAVVSTLNNKKQFSEYSKAKIWKDPLAGRWEEYITELKKKYKVEHVGYETPVTEASEIIQSCSLLVSYHGNAVWLGKWIGAPMMVFSESNLTARCFPWSIHRREECIFDLDEIQKESLEKFYRTKERLREYLK